MRTVLPQPRLNRAGSAAWALLGIAAVVLLAGWAIGKLMSVVVPFVIAILLTTLLRPVAARLERRGLGPALAAVVSVVLAIAVLAILLSLVLPPFIARLSELGSSVQEGAHRVAYEVGDRAAGMSHREVDRTIENAVERVRDRLGGTAMAGVTSAAGALASIVLIAFLAFFMVKDGRQIWGYLVGFAPAHRRADVDEVGRRAWTVLTAYTRGVVFVAIVLVQRVEGNVLYPVVVGPRLRLHPIVVLMSVALGGTLAGIPGAFLAVPVATVAATVVTYLREQRDRREAVKPEPRHGVLIRNGTHSV
jgi:predicted PurR-regulated permease PerM